MGINWLRGHGKELAAQGKPWFLAVTDRESTRHHVPQHRPYREKAPFKFNGTIEEVRVKYLGSK